MPPRSGEWRLRCSEDCPWYRWSDYNMAGQCRVRKNRNGESILLRNHGEADSPCKASDAQLRKAIAAHVALIEPVERELARRKGGGK
jgi:hypothetical protein